MLGVLVVPILFFLLFACAAPVDKPEEDSFAERALLDGIWEGSFDIRGRGPYDFQVMHIGDRSTAVSNKAKAVCVGAVRLDGDYYYAKYNLYALDGAPFDYATITGTLSEGVIDSHFVTLNGGDTGSLKIAYNSIYEQASSLDLVAGDWSFTDRDGLMINFGINADGEIAGSDSDKCKYEGQVLLINSNYNAYDFAIEISNCGSVSGSYIGMGYLENQEADFLRINFANEFYGFHFDMRK